MKLNQFAATIVAALSVPMVYAADYTAETAPDTASKSVLAAQVMRPEEGAVNSDDVAPAIHRNFPRIIEQNLAARDAVSATAYIDQLSDLELDHLAQLYVNANASSARTGKLLQVAAARLDAAHLARLAKFFGHVEVRTAVAHVAPKKLRSFEAKSSVYFLAPVAGATLSLAPLMVPTGSAGVMASGTFVPSVSMTIEELYAGFRSMQVGSMAVAGAVYETAAYSGAYLYAAWKVGYSFGTDITHVMQEYEPDFYYGPFVDAVGNGVTYVQNFVTQSYNWRLDNSSLGPYQSGTIPVYGTAASQVSSMGSYGGDWATEGAYESYTTGGSGNPCKTEGCKIDAQ